MAGNRGWLGGGALGGLAITMGVLTGLGIYLGYRLDLRFGTSPWLTVAGAFVGLGAAFFEVMTVALRAQRQDSGRRRK
jgi:F0F1-type ATP synthase assembly protein I